MKALRHYNFLPPFFKASSFSKSLINMQQISVKFPEKILEKLDERREESGVNRSSQIRRAVAEEVGALDGK